MAPRLHARAPLPPPSPPAGQPDELRERIADEQLGGERLKIDRVKLRQVVKKDVGKDVDKIEFLGSGTFHKAYLVTLSDKSQLVARIARPYFPCRKTASEVATLSYLSTNTMTPLPKVFAYDSTTCNPIGAEYTLLSFAPGLKLSSVPPSSFTPDKLHSLVRSLARLIVPLASHKFPKIGSLYFANSGVDPSEGYEVGPMVSWPFFGNGRGMREMDRGPWSTEKAYIDACVKREIEDVRREGDLTLTTSSGSASSPSVSSLSDDELVHTDDDDSDAESVGSIRSESGEDLMYRAYRQTQSLVMPFRRLSVSAPAAPPPKSRVEQVEEDMGRFVNHMESLGIGAGSDEEFTFDLQDVRAENIFVDPEDISRIACIIDFESTTIRPLWHAAHLPALILPPPPPLPFDTSPTTYDKSPPLCAVETVLSSPELQAAFREEAERLDPRWARAEREGEARRAAHRCLDWDGWEPGLVESILGPVGKA